MVEVTSTTKMQSVSLLRQAPRLLAKPLPLAPRAFSTSQSRAKYTLPDLPYDYNALEPAISAEIMQLHHTKHHQTYVNGLNQAEEQLAEALHKNDVKKQIELQSLIKFNGGGHINHTLFWQNLTPEKKGGGELKSGAIASAIEKEYGGLEGLKTKLTAAALGIQGSGWAWLALDPVTKSLVITTTANQDPLLSAIPLFGIDMWEHAFYLQHKNAKPPYLENLWKVANWETANERYSVAIKQ